jgi:hypothetical protein
MSELADRMNLIRTQLQAAMPARVVTRDLLDFALRDRADLEAGIFTLVSRGESGYQNLWGRAAEDGAHPIMLVGQIQLDEDANPSQIEDAEFLMVEQIKAFVRTVPPELCRLQMLRFRQSEQMDAPYGWVTIELEFSR